MCRCPGLLTPVLLDQLIAPSVWLFPVQWVAFALLIFEKVNSNIYENNY